MVRFVLLAVLMSACLAAAPAAQAADLPVDVQSAATAAVDQTQAVVATATTTTKTAAPATPPVSTDATPPAVAAAAELAHPAAGPAEYTAASANSVIADGSRDTDGAAPVRSARFKQGHRHTSGSGAERAGHRAALGRHPVSTTAPTQAVDQASRATGTTPKQQPAKPDRSPSSSGGGAASAPPAGLSLGGLALLAIAISLAGPRLRRRLSIRPAAIRPVTFVSLLERPG
jgi:hypothetical protein